MMDVADRLARAFARVDGDPTGETVAERMLLSGDFAAARRADAESRVMSFVRAAASLAEGDLEECRAQLRNNIDAGGKAEAHALKALLASREGNLSEAEAELTLSARLTKQPWPFVLLANLKENANDLGGARLALEEALRRDKQAWLWAELARVEERTGVIPRALKAAERAVALEPTLAHRRLRGHLLECWREHDEAAAEYALALQDAPGDAGLLFSRSRVLSAAGRMEEALEDALAAEQAAPKDPALVAWRLQIQLLSKKAKAALAELAKRLKAKGDAGFKQKLSFLHAYGLMREKKWPAAVKALDALAKALPPEDALARRASFYSTVAKVLQTPAPAKRADRVMLLGMGVDPPYTASAAILRALASADVVFNNVMGDELFEFLRALNPDVRAVNYHQDNDEEKLSEKMLAECKGGRRVAFATRGNAIVYGPLGTMLLDKAKQAGWSWRVEPCVTSWEFISGRHAPDPRAGRGMSVLDIRAAEQGRLTDPGLPTTVFFDLNVGDESLAAACRALAKQRGPRSPAWVFDHVIGQQPQLWTAGEVESERSRLSVSAIVHYPAVERSPA
jgi:tetratricopeptide (TPR) repeat protein